MRPVAVYLRVSTSEQTVENQRADVLAFCRERKWSELRTFEDVASGLKVSRPGLDELMRQAHRRELAGVVVWSIDRLDRTVVGCLSRVLELEQLGVPVHSVKEAFLGEPSTPARHAMISLFAWVAEFEGQRRRERQHAGIARARAAGKHLGRPRTPAYALEAASRARAQGATMAAAAAQGGVSVSLLREHLRKQRRQKGPSKPGWVARHKSRG